MSNKYADINGLVLVFQMIRKSLDYFANKYELSIGEINIIFDIFFTDGMTITELSERQGVPKSTVSRLVDNLVKKKMLDRIRPEENRRIVNVTISNSFRKELDSLKDDKKFQHLLEEDFPKEKGMLAVQKLGELLDVLSDK